MGYVYLWWRACRSPEPNYKSQVSWGKSRTKQKGFPPREIVRFSWKNISPLTESQPGNPQYLHGQTIALTAYLYHHHELVGVIPIISPACWSRYVGACIPKLRERTACDINIQAVDIHTSKVQLQAKIKCLGRVHGLRNVPGTVNLIRFLPFLYYGLKHTHDPFCLPQRDAKYELASWRCWVRTISQQVLIITLLLIFWLPLNFFRR